MFGVDGSRYYCICIDIIWIKDVFLIKKYLSILNNSICESVVIRLIRSENEIQCCNWTAKINIIDIALEITNENGFVSLIIEEYSTYTESYLETCDDVEFISRCIYVEELDLTLGDVYKPIVGDRLENILLYEWIITWFDE